MANLGDLALLAGLVYGVRDQRRQASRARRREDAERAEERKLRLDQFAQQKIDAEARRKREAEEAALARADYFKQGLFGSGSQDFLHGLAQSPEAFQSYMQAASQAFGGAGLPFNASAYVPQDPNAFMRASLGLPGPTEPASMPQEQMTASSLPEFDLAAALKERYQPSLKTQTAFTRAESAAGLADERAADLRATRPERLKNLRNNAAKSLAQGNYAQASADLQELRQLTEAERPAQVRAQTANVADMPASRAEQRGLFEDAFKTRDATARRGQDIGAATTRRGQDLTAADQAADRALQERRLALESVVPDPSKPWLSQLAGVPRMTMRDATGLERFLTPEERKAAEDEINENHRLMFGRPLFGPGGVIPSPGSPFGDMGGAGNAGGTAATGAMMGGLLGGGAAPGAGSAGPVGDNVEITGRMSAQEYEKYYKNAPAGLKAAIKRDRAEAIRRGLVPGAKAAQPAAKGAKGAKSAAQPAPAADDSGTVAMSPEMVELERRIRERLGMGLRIPSPTPLAPRAPKQYPGQNRSVF